MDWQTAINWGGTIALSVLGWFLNAQRENQKEVDTRLDAQRDALTAFQIKAAERYATHEHLGEIKQEIRDGFKHLGDKIDGKADK